MVSDLRNLNPCKNWKMFSTRVFEAQRPLTNNDRQRMLRKQYENIDHTETPPASANNQRFRLAEPEVASGLLQPLQPFVNPPLLMQYRGRRPAKEPVRSESVLCTSRITHRDGNLLPLLWAQLLESCLPFSVTYFVINPLLCIQILLYYLCETSSCKSHFSRGFIFSLKTEVWLVQCVSQVLHSPLCQWFALILDKTVYPLGGSRGNTIFL